MTAPAGWYADPYAPDRCIRYWNGAAWVGDAVPRPGPAGPPPPNVASPPPRLDGNRPRNGSGTAALICGLLGLIPFPITGFWLSVAAIITGIRGYSRGKSGSATNGGVALSGLILGIVGLGIQLLVALAIAFGPS